MKAPKGSNEPQLDLGRPASTKRFIGVVHLHPLPGSPGYAGDLEGVLDAAAEDARALARGGAHGAIVENFGDRPFRPGRVDPETVAAMARALERCREAAPDLPLGANVLRNDGRSALGLVAAGAASFVRINVHTGAAVTDQGLIEGRADETLRTRVALAPACPLLCDVHVKHAVPLCGGDLVQAALDTYERGMADALILTGSGTGHAPDPDPIQRVRRALPEAPLFLGSGFSVENAGRFREHLDGAIVGTATKRDGRVDAPVDPERVARLVDALG